ncbi:TfoX C-terminal domain-containing protein [Cohaesibacter gelatinilyticus]|uniref:TfoX C-terminal domain-containing protein n=2 Tax=Cohaesibacter gelatinilyticus TaxID=372072 RepID=A0A285NJ47_9HYPH|nr:TfoX C-terminal domain-containing protein [Cohaesibacter gelatinilyticus]
MGEMMNLGPQSQKWLKELEIHTEEDLRKHDILDVYLELKARHPQKTTLMMLWALQGALLDMNCIYLPAEIKDQLKKELAERK